MSCWGKDQQVCASCRYWGGKREVDVFAQFFDAEDGYGICYGPAGSFRGIETNQGGSCSEWENFRSKD